MAKIISAKQFGFTSLGSLIVVVEIRYNIILQAFCFLGQEIFFLRAVNGLTANWLFHAYIHEGHFIWGTTCEIQSSVV